MKPAHLGFAALAVLAATAGYAVHQFTSTARVEEAQALAAGPTDSASATTPSAVFDWSFVDVDGKSQPLAQWKGQLVVLNFWATWCPPCLKEIPAFVDLQQRLGSRPRAGVALAPLIDKPHPENRHVVGDVVSDRAVGPRAVESAPGADVCSGRGQRRSLG